MECEPSEAVEVETSPNEIGEIDLEEELLTIDEFLVQVLEEEPVLPVPEEVWVHDLDRMESKYLEA